MPKKALNPPLSPITNTHVGLLQKAGAASTSAKWCSLGAISKKLQPNLFGCSSLQVRNEKGMIGEEVLLDGEDLYTDGVPSGQEDRYYRYRVDTYNEGKVRTFNLTYLEQCIKYSGNEWISLPDDSEDGSEKLLENFPKDLVLAGHVRMREKLVMVLYVWYRWTCVGVSSYGHLVLKLHPFCSCSIELNNFHGHPHVI